MPYSDMGKRLSQDTFYGRWRAIVDLMHPLLLRYSPYRLQRAKSKLDKYRGPTATKPEDPPKMWNLRWLVDSAYQPGTGKQIPLLFRMSTFVPINAVLLRGIIQPSLTTPLWRIASQCYYAGFNYYNGNLTDSLHYQELKDRCLLAIGSSVAVDLGVSLLFLTFSKSNFMEMFGFVTALAVAGCVNLHVMRRKKDGESVAVYSHQGAKVGFSMKADEEGYFKTMLIRFAMQYPVVYFSELIIVAGHGNICMELGLISLSLFMTVPVMFALYPQMLHKEKLEKRLPPPPGGLYFNRGL